MAHRSVWSIGEKDKNTNIFKYCYNIPKHEIGRTCGVPSQFVMAIQIFLTCQFPILACHLALGTLPFLCPAYECGILLLPLLVRSSKNIEVPDLAVGFKDSCNPFCGSQLSKVVTENQMLLAVFCTRLYDQNYFP